MWDLWDGEERIQATGPEFGAAADPRAHFQPPVARGERGVAEALEDEKD